MKPSLLWGLSDRSACKALALFMEDPDSIPWTKSGPLVLPGMTLNSEPEESHEHQEVWAPTTRKVYFSKLCLLLSDM